jgi:hypothetical protein
MGRYGPPKGNNNAAGHEGYKSWGNQFAVGHGAPAGNTNAVRHGLRSDLDNYHDNLDPDGKAEVRMITESILDRAAEHRGISKPSEFTEDDVELAEQVAIRIHLGFHAMDYTRENGLFEESDHLLDGLRRHDKSIFDDLEELGAIDSNENSGWRAWLEDCE